MSSIAQKIGINQEIDESYKSAKIRNFEDYMALPETNQRYEIIDGRIIMPPAPNIKHQLLIRRLFRLLDRYVEQHKLGDVLWAPLDIQITTIPFRTRQPDLFFISKKRSGGGFAELDSSTGIQLLDVGPEFVVEVLSPSDTRKIVQEKLTDYQKIGVDECWLVSPEAETVEILKLSQDRVERIGIFGVGDKIRSEVLSGLVLSVDEVFA